MNPTNTNYNFRADPQLVLKHAVSERFWVRISELEDWAFFSTTKNEVSMMQLHHFPIQSYDCRKPTSGMEAGHVSAATIAFHDAHHQLNGNS